MAASDFPVFRAGPSDFKRLARGLLFRMLYDLSFGDGTGARAMNAKCF